MQCRVTKLSAGVMIVSCLWLVIFFHPLITAGKRSGGFNPGDEAVSTQRPTNHVASVEPTVHATIRNTDASESDAEPSVSAESSSSSAPPTVRVTSAPSAMPTTAPISNAPISIAPTESATKLIESSSSTDSPTSEPTKEATLQPTQTPTTQPPTHAPTKEADDEHEESEKSVRIATSKPAPTPLVIHSQFSNASFMYTDDEYAELENIPTYSRSAHPFQTMRVISDAYLKPAFTRDKAIDPELPFGSPELLTSTVSVDLSSGFEIHKHAQLKWRLRNLRLLEDVDAILKKYKVHFFLSHGTLLGSFRHGEQMPWDYDIDISLPSEEYAKLHGKQSIDGRTVDTWSSIKAELASKGLMWEEYYHCNNRPYNMIVFYSRNGGKGEFNPASEFMNCIDSTIGFWSKICVVANGKKSSICMDIWQVVPVTLNNVTMYTNVGEPQVFLRSDVYPLKRCYFHGKPYWCPNRSRLLLNYLYQPSIQAPWTCKANARRKQPKVCKPIQRDASSTYISQFNEYQHDRQYPDIPLMYYDKKQQHLKFHMPTHVVLQSDEVASHDKRGITVGLDQLFAE